MNKDYLTYIIKELRESTAVESAIGYEFTKKDNAVSDNFNDCSFLSCTLPESKIYVPSEHKESRIGLQAESDQTILLEKY